MVVRVSDILFVVTSHEPICCLHFFLFSLAMIGFSGTSTAREGYLSLQYCLGVSGTLFFRYFYYEGWLFESSVVVSGNWVPDESRGRADISTTVEGYLSLQ